MFLPLYDLKSILFPSDEISPAVIRSGHRTVFLPYLAFLFGREKLSGSIGIVPTLLSWETVFFPLDFNRNSNFRKM